MMLILLHENGSMFVVLETCWLKIEHNSAYAAKIDRASRTMDWYETWMARTDGQWNSIGYHTIVRIP